MNEKQLEAMMIRMLASREGPNENHKFEYNGESGYLNSRLIRNRNISDENVEKLKQSHVERLRIFEQMEQTDDVAELKRLAKEFEQLEFRQQELWGFPQDANFHRFFDVPKCLCPKMDNEDRLGTSWKIYSMDCPIHGKEKNEIE